MKLPPFPDFRQFMSIDSENKIQAYGRACYIAALEEAAKACETSSPRAFTSAAIMARASCAAAIRALKDKP